MTGLIFIFCVTSLLFLFAFGINKIIFWRINKRHFRQQKIFIDTLQEDLVNSENVDVEIFSNKRSYQVSGNNFYFRNAQLVCTQDSLFIYDGFSKSLLGHRLATPIILTQRKKGFHNLKENAFICTPYYLNTNSFNDAIHIEFHPNERQEIMIDLRLINASSEIKRKIDELNW